MRTTATWKMGLASAPAPRLLQVSRYSALRVAILLLGMPLVSSAAAQAATTKPESKPAGFHPGPSITFARRTKSSNCRVHGGLPDARCTPGARFKNADRAHICKSGYSASVRNVSQKLKAKVYAEYKISRHSAKTYEVDHLVPLELGGSNSIANLFPEAARPRPGFHEKDRLENKTHDQVCANARPLRATQRSIARDWTVLYKVYFG